MWEHTRDVNGGVVGPNGGVDEYRVSGWKVDEDVRMQQFEAEGGVLLNSKYEYYMP